MPGTHLRISLHGTDEEMAFASAQLELRSELGASDLRRILDEVLHKLVEDAKEDVSVGQFADHYYVIRRMRDSA